MTRKNLANRRAFLRSSSALIALPTLESLSGRRVASAAPAVAATAASEPKKRMVFLSFGWGVTKEAWYPDKSTTGADYVLPSGLQPLARHQKDITVIQNLQNNFSSEAHWGSTFYLTGANRYSEPGQSFSNSISADQVAAATFGRATRFTSLQLGCKNASGSGHGPGLSLAWNAQGKPLGGHDTPLAAYHRLFSNDDTPLAQRQEMLLKQRSILDAVLDDAKTAKRGLNANDTDKLNEYFESIRDIETRLAKEEQWLDIPKAKPADAVDEPDAKMKGYDEIKLMYDIMIAAMQVDATRVMTYRQPVDSLIRGLGASITGHNMSHYTNGNRIGVSKMRDEKQSELLAYFIDKLKASKEADGSSLFDHTSLSYGSNIHNSHNLTNCPTVLAGGGAGVKHGRHLVLEDEKTPLANLWFSLLQGVGLNVQSHGDSTGTIKQLFA